MSISQEIEDALCQLGSVAPPAGLEQRLQNGLRRAPRRLAPSVTYGIAGVALAAGIALSAVALSPNLRHVVFSQKAPAQNLGTASGPRVVPAGGFGTAGAVHVPLEPVPVQPTPINQGRGRSRSGRATLRGELAAPLPRGVAPSQPAARTGTADR